MQLATSRQPVPVSVLEAFSASSIFSRKAAGAPGSYLSALCGHFITSGPSGNTIPLYSGNRILFSLLKFSQNSPQSACFYKNTELSSNFCTALFSQVTYEYVQIASTCFGHQSGKAWLVCLTIFKDTRILFSTFPVL